MRVVTQITKKAAMNNYMKKKNTYFYNSENFIQLNK
jgi:hypothetical protein